MEPYSNRPQEQKGEFKKTACTTNARMHRKYLFSLYKLAVWIPLLLQRMEPCPNGPQEKKGGFREMLMYNQEELIWSLM